MKITSVECYFGPYIFVKINTDEGISGFGEAGLSYGQCKQAAFGNCQDFAKIIIGMDPFDTEKIWKHMYRDTFWGMGGGVTVTAAMAAIDTACWDIKGKALGVPVYKLLGGKTNSKLRAYASQLQFGWRKANEANEFVLYYDPEEYYNVTREAIEDGYDAIKVDPITIPPYRGNPEEFFATGGWHTRGSFPLDALRIATERIAACREAAGPDVDIIVETHSLLDANTAPALLDALEPYNIMYFEEPTSPANPELFKYIAQKTHIPLATGERSYTRWGFTQFFEDRSLGIIQPDLCNTGGITETKKICDMAEVYDMGVQVHVCGGPIATAAALQVEAVIPNFTIHEQHCNTMQPAYYRFATYRPEPVNGYYDIPDRPGIGEEITEAGMAECEKVVIK